MITDVRFYQEGLARALAQRFRVVGTAACPAEAITELQGASPEIALLDVAPEGSVSWLRAIHRAAPKTRLVALAVPDADDDILACAEAGIAAYVTRDASLSELMETLDGVARGEARCSPRVAAGLLRRLALLAGQAEARPSGRLTAREREVLDLIDEGLSNKQIAAHLCIKLSTVKNHVHNILDKVGASRRGEAAARISGRASRAPGRSTDLDPPVQSALLS